jgi:hypothetical protein
MNPTPKPKPEIIGDQCKKIIFIGGPRCGKSRIDDGSERLELNGHLYKRVHMDVDKSGINLSFFVLAYFGKVGDEVIDAE